MTWIKDNIHALKGSKIQCMSVERLNIMATIIDWRKRLPHCNSRFTIYYGTLEVTFCPLKLSLPVKYGSYMVTL